jgi:hypothetical protein
MHRATISSQTFTRHDASLFEAGRSQAMVSDAAGLFDVDSLNDRAQLHRLFEGAVIVSEIDEFVDFGTIGFDD